MTLANSSSTTSRTSADGRYLLFESSANVTGYESGGPPEAYLYDAGAKPGEEATRCLSCRLDGKPPVLAAGEAYPYLLASSANAGAPLYQPQSLVVREGRPAVFFSSLDPLAPGAAEGAWNLYEFSHGQVSLVAAEARGAGVSSANLRKLSLAGASAEGTDLYLYANRALNWENPESRPQAWDARIGGGFAEPPAPAAPCDASAEGACQGASQAAPAAAPGAASKDFGGPGNVKPKPHKKKTHKKKRHRRHHHKKRRGHAKKRHKGKGQGKPHAKQHHKRAGHDRRAGK